MYNETWIHSIFYTDKAGVRFARQVGLAGDDLSLGLIVEKVLAKVLAKILLNTVVWRKLAFPYFENVVKCSLF